MTFDGDGSLIEVTEKVSARGLPSPVFAAPHQAGRAGKVGNIESVISGGMLTARAATITRSGLRRAFVFGPHGTRRAAD